MKKIILKEFSQNPIQILHSIGFSKINITAAGQFAECSVAGSKDSFSVNLNTGQWSLASGASGDLFDLYSRINELPRDMSRAKIISELAIELGIESSVYGT